MTDPHQSQYMAVPSFATASSLTTQAHCDAVWSGIHAMESVAHKAILLDRNWLKLDVGTELQGAAPKWRLEDVMRLLSRELIVGSDK